MTCKQGAAAQCIPDVGDANLAYKVSCPHVSVSSYTFSHKPFRVTGLRILCASKFLSCLKSPQRIEHSHEVIFHLRAGFAPSDEFTPGASNWAVLRSPSNLNASIVANASAAQPFAVATNSRFGEVM